MLWVEEDSHERDTAASEKVCAKVQSLKCIQRLGPELRYITYQFLNLATPRDFDHGEISEVVRPHNDSIEAIYTEWNSIDNHAVVYLLLHSRKHLIIGLIYMFGCS